MQCLMSSNSEKVSPPRLPRRSSSPGGAMGSSRGAGPRCRGTGILPVKTKQSRRAGIRSVFPIGKTRPRPPRRSFRPGGATGPSRGAGPRCRGTGILPVKTKQSRRAGIRSVFPMAKTRPRPPGGVSGLAAQRDQAAARGRGVVSSARTVPSIPDGRWEKHPERLECRHKTEERRDSQLFRVTKIGDCP